ncbi:hypothetical protein HYH03_002174 [Edaphochlamys debaryana]|uniref:CBM20 domain-containing protein n=1 Tax=Edaphochlamys debaryana TaxID=47281 RepID=A0A836C4I5_9CHLO|nr:hypothetical protein HYH03_002174 [Edaphochlamys debaryana]|eukprot:KAG2499885.1 hypothetical protein HYH03_002174 [Edaphochlamys debaryana]
MLSTRAPAVRVSCARAGRVAPRPVVLARATQTQTITRTAQVAYDDEVESLDVESMCKRLEARAKAMIQLEEQEVASRCKVKFVIKQRLALGEAWKICGTVPELGRMTPEVAPYMKWNTGDVWTLELKVRPGPVTWKAVIRKPDGQYVWEAGKDRSLEVPFGEPSKTVEIAPKFE